eukprot:snap_masked-scaffold_10-processed-gene-12.23-mRNA-1 protein AED:1.00 eAED:1.00 QI:0/0/0/0/1/1/2/0/74
MEEQTVYTTRRFAYDTWTTHSAVFDHEPRLKVCSSASIEKNYSDGSYLLGIRKNMYFHNKPPLGLYNNPIAIYC